MKYAILFVPIILAGCVGPMTSNSPRPKITPRSFTEAATYGVDYKVGPYTYICRVPTKAEYAAGYRRNFIALPSHHRLTYQEKLNNLEFQNQMNQMDINTNEIELDTLKSQEFNSGLW